MSLKNTTGSKAKSMHMILKNLEARILLSAVIITISHFVASIDFGF